MHMCGYTITHLNSLCVASGSVVPAKLADVSTDKQDKKNINFSRRLKCTTVYERLIFAMTIKKYSRLE